MFMHLPEHAFIRYSTIPLVSLLIGLVVVHTYTKYVYGSEKNQISTEDEDEQYSKSWGKKLTFSGAGVWVDTLSTLIIEHSTRRTGAPTAAVLGAHWIGFSTCTSTWYTLSIASIIEPLTSDTTSYRVYRDNYSIHVMLNFA